MQPISNTYAIPRHGYRLEPDNLDGEAYVKHVNGEAITYTFSFSAICAATSLLEKRLKNALVPMSNRVGFTAVISSGGPLKKRRGRWTLTGYGTTAHLRRYKDGWRLMKAERVTVYGGQPPKCKIAVSARDFEAIRDRAVALFTVQS
jgi:hypothetical protein